MPLGLAKLNVDTIADTLAIKTANGLFNALDYRLPQVSSYYAGDERKTERPKDTPVSYTHLTLPTIYSV